jgi:hypothetical protein
MTVQAPAAPVDQTDDFTRDLGKRYVAAFGDIGAAWFIEGKTFEECFALKIDGIEMQLAAKVDRIAELETQVEALLMVAGEGEPLSTDEGEQLSDGEQALAARIAELTSSGVDPNKAKFMAKTELKLSSN